MKGLENAIELMDYNRSLCEKDSKDIKIYDNIISMLKEEAEKDMCDVCVNMGKKYKNRCIEYSCFRHSNYADLFEAKECNNDSDK